MPGELFADYYRWIVTSGGTDAPAAGTSQTFTVFSSSGAPAAVTGVSQFRIVDAADNSTPPEIMLVTNVSGNTWTVTRGAEGAVPWVHAGRWTAVPVLSAGAAQNLVPRAGGSAAYTHPLPWFNVMDFLATGSGITDDTAAINNAIAAVPASGGIVFFPPGNYLVSPTSGICIDLTATHNVTLMGVAGNTAPSVQQAGSTIFCSTSGAKIFNVGSSSGENWNAPSFANLRIEDHVGSCYGLYISATSGVLVDHCYFHGGGFATNYAIYVTGGGIDSSYHQFSHLNVHRWTTGIYFDALSADCTITGGYYDSTTANHVLIDMDGGEKSIVGAKFECNLATGSIAIRTKGTQSEIIGCNFEGCPTGVSLTALASLTNANNSIIACGFTGTNGTETAVSVGTNHQYTQVAFNRYSNLAHSVSDSGTDTQIIGYSGFTSDTVMQQRVQHLAGAGAAPAASAVNSSTSVGSSGTDFLSSITFTTPATVAADTLYVQVTYAKAFKSAPTLMVVGGTAATVVAGPFPGQASQLTTGVQLGLHNPVASTAYTIQLMAIGE